jgi:hypothetical protein
VYPLPLACVSLAPFRISSGYEGFSKGKKKRRFFGFKITVTLHFKAVAMQFVVPSGASAGQQVRVTTSDRKTVHVRVPEGARPGQTVAIHTDPNRTPFTAFDFQKGALDIGSIRGIPIRVHPTFFCVLALQVAMGLGTTGWLGFAYSLVIYGPVLFITILVSGAN